MEALSTKIVFSYFRFCGFCHFTPDLKPMSQRDQKINISLTIIHLMILSSILIATIFYAEDVYDMKDFHSASKDILRFLLSVLCPYVTLIESIKTGRIRQRFWNRINVIDKGLLGTPSPYIHQRVNRFLYKATFLLIGMTSIDLIILYQMRYDDEWFNHILITLYPYYMCRSQILFCVYLIDMLKCRMNMLMIYLVSMQSKSTFWKSAWNLMNCKKSYGMMWQCLQDINQSVGLSSKFSSK